MGGEKKGNLAWKVKTTKMNKKAEIIKCTGKRMKLETMILSEAPQSERQMLDVCFICGC